MSARLRSLIVPALFTFVVAGVLIGLGIWQLQRLAWKDALIARIEARAGAPARPLPPRPQWGSLSPDAYEYEHVAVDGTFDHAAETLILRASADGPGYHVVTPLALAGGGTILVDRGFVPSSLADRKTRAAGEVAGPVHLTGLLRAPEPRNAFTPADEPDRGTFYTRDPALIAAHLNLADPAPFSMDVDASTTNPGGWPKPGLTELAIPNNHFSYAMTWFGLALGLLGVFVGYAWSKLAPEAAIPPRPSTVSRP